MVRGGNLGIGTVVPRMVGLNDIGATTPVHEGQALILEPTW